MTLRVAINGFGRIGRNFMRCWLSRGANTDIELVGINGSGDTSTNAHLLKYDSMLGPIRNAEVSHTDNSIIVNGKEIKVFYDRNPLNLPWKEWGIDLVIESTGVFNDDVGAIGPEPLDRLLRLRVRLRARTQDDPATTG